MDHDKEIEVSKLAAANAYGADQERDPTVSLAPLGEVLKGRWERSWPVIACGAGLFSDGYLNGVIGSVTTMLRLIYGDEYTKSAYKSAVPSIAFAGTVVGHLFFGILSDHWSRRNTLLISTISTSTSHRDVQTEDVLTRRQQYLSSFRFSALERTELVAAHKVFSLPCRHIVS